MAVMATIASELHNRCFNMVQTLHYQSHQQTSS